MWDRKATESNYRHSGARDRARNIVSARERTNPVYGTHPYCCSQNTVYRDFLMKQYLKLRKQVKVHFLKSRKTHENMNYWQCRANTVSSLYNPHDDDIKLDESTLHPYTGNVALTRCVCSLIPVAFRSKIENRDQTQTKIGNCLLNCDIIK